MHRKASRNHSGNVAAPFLPSHAPPAGFTSWFLSTLTAEHLQRLSPGGVTCCSLSDHTGHQQDFNCQQALDQWEHSFSCELLPQ